jgi:ATP/maltotriose-dependent transcriptional regulator MalT
MALDEILGRDDELAVIDELLRPASLPLALVIRGEAGIGKTTLWRQAVSVARKHSYRILSSAPSAAETSLSFSGIADLLADDVDFALPRLPAPQSRALEVALRRSDPDENPPDQYAFRAAFLSVLRTLAEERPVVVAIDDVQWLDTPSRLALEFATRRLKRVPLAFVLAVRHTGGKLPLGLDRVGSELQVSAVSLGPLSLGALHRLVRSRLGASIPRPLLRRLYETSEGNPLYALELARELQRRKLELRPGETLPLPADLQALLQNRLSRLRPRTRAVLLGASALAEPAVDVLESAYGRHRVTSALDEASRAHVIEPDAERVRFTHPLLTSACYRAAPLRDRQLMHRRLAAIVEEPEERARQLARSVDGEDEEVALVLEEAARDASLRGGPEVAAELGELAVAHTPARQQQSFLRRATAVGDYHLTSGEAERARVLYRQALDRASNDRDRAESLIRLAESDEDTARGIKLAEQALALSGDDPARACRAHTFLAFGYTSIGEPLEKGLAHSRSAVELAQRAGDVALLIEALTMAGERTYFTGNYEDAFSAVEWAVALEREHGGRLFHSPRLTLARGLTHQGRLDEAREVFSELQKEAIEHGDEWARLRILWNRAELERVASKFDAAYRCASTGLELAEAVGMNVHRLLLAQGEAAVYLGRVDEARAVLSRCRELSESASARDCGLATEWALGFLELSLGNLEAADRSLRPVPATLLAQGDRTPSVRGWANSIEALIGIGELEQARSYLAHYEKFARAAELPRARTLAPVFRCRGLLFAAQGDLADALGASEAALVEHDRAEGQFERARTLLCYGSVLRRAKRRADARRRLEEALATFERLGTPLWADKARAELARIGGRTRSRELTESERRIAELVAEGRSNKEVAAELFVTPKTVETRLSRMYAKLGIHSRTELTRRVLDEQRVGIS